jgi:hypothetical protein
MQNQNPQDNQTGQDTLSEASGTAKTMLLAICGVVGFLAIMVLLPMLLTYLSEGDVRAPASITDRYSDTEQNFPQGDASDKVAAPAPAADSAKKRLTSNNFN